MIKIHRLATRIKSIHLLLVGCVIIAVSVFFLTCTINQKPFDPPTFLKKIRGTATNEDTFFGSIRDQLRDIVGAGGTPGAIELTHEAFAQGDIGLIHCHMLMHIIGHIAEASEIKDSKSIGIYSLDLCGSGYNHGLEAEIARTNSYNMRDQLYNLCTTMQATSPGVLCYEGAGHAFMTKTLNVDTALSMCDKLVSDGPVRDPMMCYKGLFAEYTDLIGGDDSETGTRYTGGPPLVLPADTPIAYCASLGKKYQAICAHEVCGFRAIGDIKRALTEAVTGNYPLELKAACVGNSAGARVESELSRAQTIAIPPMVFSFPKELRKEYIAGSMWGFNEYNKVGAPKDWQRFCNAFTEEDRVFCTNLVQKK